MTREQQEATRDLDRALERWLRSYGWQTDIHGRWRHQHHAQAVRTLDAWALTRAQPLIFGASERFGGR